MPRRLPDIMLILSAFKPDFGQRDGRLHHRRGALAIPVTQLATDPVDRSRQVGGASSAPAWSLQMKTGQISTGGSPVSWLQHPTGGYGVSKRRGARNMPQAPNADSALAAAAHRSLPPGISWMIELRPGDGQLIPSFAAVARVPSRCRLPGRQIVFHCRHKRRTQKPTGDGVHNSATSATALLMPLRPRHRVNHCRAAV